VRKFILSHRAFGATTDQRRRLLLEGGLRIRTSLDPRLQALAEQAAGRVISQPATDPATALVALDPVTGHVKAYVGGSDYFGPAPWAKLDLAGGGCRGDGQGCRQAGSTFKPFALAAALEAGLPLTRTYDAPGSLTIPIEGQEPWLVDNYDGSGQGRMNLAEATVQSVNTVYAQLVMDIGAQAVVDMAADMGVASPLHAVPSAALGTNGVTVLDMASAYETLAGDGMHTQPVFVTRVAERDGTVLYDAPVQRTRVLPADTARIITGVLQDVVNRGTGVNARIGRPVAGKTGTGEEWQDAWFVGYTPELVAAVWVGFPDAERTMRPPVTRITVTGGSWPAQIWQLFAGAALAETPVTAFPAVETATPTTAPATPGGPRLQSLLGLSVAQATRTLRDAGYRARLRAAPSRDYPPGVIMDQDPPAGSDTEPGATVTITVANGPPQSRTVPGVLGAYADEAAASLRAAGFTVAVTVRPEPPPGDPARAGRVWKQSPFSGAIVDEGSTVTITVNP
jgi:penicillin-binding protein 1A